MGRLTSATSRGVRLFDLCHGRRRVSIQDGIHVLVRDEPDAIAAAVRQLTEDEALRARLVAAGTEHYRQHYRPQAAVDAVTAVVDHVLSGTAGESGRGAG